jgi:hypothetical protein
MSKPVKFMNNNLAELDGVLTASTAATGYPVSNLINENRSKQWRASGYWVIDSTNNKFHFADFGGTKVATIDTGIYTADTLATEIETKVTAASVVSWTVTYSTSTYRFTITTTPAIGNEIHFSNQTDAIFDTIGFTTLTDYLFGAAISSDEVRIHTSEFLKLDLGSNAWDVDWVALMHEIGTLTTLTQEASISIYANNLDDFDSATLLDTASVHDLGLMTCFDTETVDTAYRYWWYEFIDRRNPGGPEAIRGSYFYLGDSISFTGTNIAQGMTKRVVDPTILRRSQSNRRYFNIKTRHNVFDDLQIQLPTKDDRTAFEQFVYDFGVFKPFFIAIDPGLAISDELQELTLFGYFDTLPDIDHQFLKFWNIVGFTVRESV